MPIEAHEIEGKVPKSMIGRVISEDEVKVLLKRLDAK